MPADLGVGWKKRVFRHDVKGKHASWPSLAFYVMCRSPSTETVPCGRLCGRALASCHVRADTETEVVLLQFLGQDWEGGSPR